MSDAILVNNAAPELELATTRYVSIVRIINAQALPETLTGLETRFPVES